MTPKILLEDASILVVDKPSGMVVNRAESVKTDTIQDWLDENFDWALAHDTENRNGIVHRIDKETSGVLVIAKTLEGMQELQRQFKAREVDKTYLALVHGKFEREQGIINAPVGRLPWNRERFGILPGGREAETQYKVIEVFSKPSISDKNQTDYYSLVEFYPKTGRTHQIRVHAKYLHHALVADEFYAGRKTSRRDREWCPRLFLHAAKISFTHPETKERVSIESGLPEDLTQALASFNKSIV